MALIGEIINNALVLSLQRAEPNATSILWYELIFLKNRFFIRKKRPFYRRKQRCILMFSQLLLRISYWNTQWHSYCSKTALEFLFDFEGELSVSNQFFTPDWAEIFNNQSPNLFHILCMSVFICNYNPK